MRTGTPRSSQVIYFFLWQLKGKGLLTLCSWRIADGYKRRLFSIGILSSTAALSMPSLQNPKCFSDCIIKSKLTLKLRMLVHKIALHPYCEDRLAHGWSSAHFFTSDFCGAAPVGAALSILLKGQVGGGITLPCYLTT